MLIDFSKLFQVPNPSRPIPGAGLGLEGGRRKDRRAPSVFSVLLIFLIHPIFPIYRINPIPSYLSHLSHSPYLSYFLLPPLLPEEGTARSSEQGWWGVLSFLTGIFCGFSSPPARGGVARSSEPRGWECRMCPSVFPVS